MIYVGLQVYNEEETARVLESGCDGIVIGDILCNKRMFPFAGNEICELFQQIKDKGKKVIYQTLMYATDRIFGEVISKIQYYYEKKYIDAVIVQDVGIANKIKNICPNLEIIWGRMGYARNPITNLTTLDFYKSVGVSAVECKDIQTANIARELGFSPYLLIGSPSYTTINRECYFKYEHNIFDDNCARGCLNHERMIIPTESAIETTIDGYVLGYKNIYLDESIENAYQYENVIIYAATAQECCQYYDAVTGGN